MIAALVVAAALFASPVERTDATDPRLAERLDRATAAIVGSFIDSAGAAGIPTEPLVQRALQGATKRAPGARIIAAVREYAVELRASRDAIGSRSRQPEIIAGASAIHAGATLENLRALRSLRAGDMTISLAVLADLVGSGVPVSNALSAIRTALEKRVTDQELTTLRNNVATDIKAGISPPTAAAVRARGLNVGKPAALPQPAAGTNKRPPEIPAQSRGRNR